MKAAAAGMQTGPAQDGETVDLAKLHGNEHVDRARATRAQAGRRRALGARQALLGVGEPSLGHGYRRVRFVAAAR